jgi:hypothetical protein
MGCSELVEVAYNARCGAARRIALVRLNDPAMNAAFAQEDADPMVRRRLARVLDDAVFLERILRSTAMPPCERRRSEGSIY